MKWGNKKKTSSASPSSSSSTSSHSHLISHVFPQSWLSKFKQSSEKTGNKMSKNNPSEIKKENLEKLSPRASFPNDSNYYKDKDGFWRFSMGEKRLEVDEKFTVHQNNSGNCKTNVKEVATKKSGVQEVKKVYNEVNGYRKSVEKELLEDELLNVMQMLERVEERPTWTTTSKNTNVVPRDFDSGKSNWQELKDAKMKQVLLKTEKQRKSFHISRESKVRVSSPRTPLKTETFKIRALEDMKKAKLKSKAKEIAQQERAMSSLGSFAVVKRSQDPQQDFKDSMFEMILAKRITRPEELEELLACYLTLNADEYHDLIVKVFKQVWCELEQSSSNN
ncbi:uncharacterized protein LOC141642913 [Silene latifolia]|uniref:uncharacterized protein LOC141642913 n=1 Tax=Silene latifolia TaxID=37657 RepID=UPI003D76E6A8